MSGQTVPSGAGGFSRADARRNRAKVLAAAQRAFATEGLSVSLGEIARRAGVGAGTVYRHFPSKEELLEAVLSQRIERLTKLAGDYSAGADPGAGFFAFIDEVVGSTTGNRDLCDLFDAQDGWPRALLLTSGKRFGEALDRLLAAAQRQGAVRSDVDSADIQELFTGWVAMRRYRDGTGEPGRMVPMMVDLLRVTPATVTKMGDARQNRDEIRGAVDKRNTAADPTCPVCSRPVTATGAGRPARYCGAPCRQRAYRQRAKTVV